MSTYPDLHGSFGWSVGVHRSPVACNHLHAWLAVGSHDTQGGHTQASARQLLRNMQIRDNVVCNHSQTGQVNSDLCTNDANHCGFHRNKDKTWKNV